MTKTLEPSSFRDKSGIVFYEDNEVYRQVNKSYREEFDFLMDSGLYKKLESSRLIVPHVEVDSIPENEAYKIIKPTKIPFISYPYEWSFSQLKQAALTTLEIQKISMEYGMTLKDASAYNIQMLDGNYILIDTLSFERYEEGQPWKAYKQFCQHFLAPLALMSHQDIRLNGLSRIFIDGIPLDLTSKLLPFKTKTMFTLLSHIHAHAKTQKKYEDVQVDFKKRKLSKRSFMGIVQSLDSGIRKLNYTPEGTEWAEYYDKTNYSTQSFQHKKEIISRYVDSIKPTQVWDLGANTGIFSRIASGKGIPVVAFDIEPAAVELNYLECARNDEKNILPLVLDLTNPSPGVGWENQERLSILNRGPVDTIMALALIHHLSISNNVPISKVVDFLESLCNNLIIEFVPKEDSQVRRLLSTREDVFDDYDEDNFVREFGKKFEIVEFDKIPDTERTMYCMRNKMPR